MDVYTCNECGMKWRDTKKERPSSSIRVHLITAHAKKCLGMISLLINNNNNNNNNNNI